MYKKYVITISLLFYLIKLKASVYESHSTCLFDCSNPLYTCYICIHYIGLYVCTLCTLCTLYTLCVKVGVLLISSSRVSASRKIFSSILRFIPEMMDNFILSITVWLSGTWSSVASSNGTVSYHLMEYCCSLLISV